jgi:hypothetical protein
MHKIRSALTFMRTHQQIYWRYVLIGIAVVMPIFLVQSLLVVKFFKPQMMIGPLLVAIVFGIMLATIAAQRSHEAALKKALAERSKAEQKSKQLFESNQDGLMTLAPPSWKFSSCNAGAVWCGIGSRVYQLSSRAVITRISTRWAFIERQSGRNDSTGSARRLTFI